MKRTLSRIALVVAFGIAFGEPAAGITGMPTVPIPAPTGEPLAVEGKRFVAAWMHALRDSSARYDADALVAGALAAAQPGESRQIFFDRIAIAIAGTYWSFAPLDAVHDDATRYRLPFPLDEPRLLAQGPGGRFTHQGDQYFSFDFAMPVGSRVLAAREGVVGRVRDGSTRGGFDKSNGGFENDVLVLHSDGTVGFYVHLRAGIPVREGQRVAQGDLIGDSGKTGYSVGPHLHFMVVRRTGAAAFDSIPIRFGVGSPVGFVPEERQFYGGRSKTTVELALSADGAPLSDATPLRLGRGAQARISVTLTAPGSPPVDVSADPATHFYTPTDWSLVVDPHGTATAAPDPDVAKAIAANPELQPSGSTDWGVVVVTYTRADRNHVGFASVPVMIVDAAPR